MVFGPILQTVQKVAGLVCSTEIVHVINLYQCMEAEIVLYSGMSRYLDLVTKPVVQVTLYISSIFMNVSFVPSSFS